MKNTVLITGAARGLGRAIVEQFHAKGWTVFATDIDAEVLTEHYTTNGIHKIQMDVCSDLSVRQAYEQIREVTGSLDLIIDNAGIDRYFPLSEAPAEHIKNIFEVNFFGTYRVNQVFLPMLKSPGGGIIAIGSESLHLRMPFLSYPITKRALENYMLALRQELWFSGRWATIVRCGPVRTRITENVFHLENEFPGTQMDPVFERFAAAAPVQVGQMSDPSEVAAFIYRTACKTHPKAIYRINNRFILRILSWVPFGIVEKRVRRMLR